MSSASNKLFSFMSAAAMFASLAAGNAESGSESFGSETKDSKNTVSDTQKYMNHFDILEDILLEHDLNDDSDSSDDKL